MRRIHSRSLAVAALGIGLATPAFAATGPFDLIYADRVDVTLCEGCVYTLVGRDFGLLVNRGTDPVTMGDLDPVTFGSVSSRPEVVLQPFINTTHLIAPLQPNEAVGTVIAGDNEVLVTQLLPGETFRNTAPEQFIAFAVGRAAPPRPTRARRLRHHHDAGGPGRAVPHPRRRPPRAVRRGLREIPGRGAHQQRAGRHAGTRVELGAHQDAVPLTARSGPTPKSAGPRGCLPLAPPRRAQCGVLTPRRTHLRARNRPTGEIIAMQP
jgi:hypothetical protein